MYKILIKDTTKEEREEIVRQSLEFSDIGCGLGDPYEMYRDYIEGRKELREINEENMRGYVTEQDRYHNGGCEMF